MGPPNHCKDQINTFLTKHPSENKDFVLICGRNNYGSIRCVICHDLMIDLTHDYSLEDGGLNQGCGTLRAFEEHTRGSTHMMNLEAHESVIAKESKPKTVQTIYIDSDYQDSDIEIMGGKETINSSDEDDGKPIIVKGMNRGRIKGKATQNSILEDDEEMLFFPSSSKINVKKELSNGLNKPQSEVQKGKRRARDDSDSDIEIVDFKPFSSTTSTSTSNSFSSSSRPSPKRIAPKASTSSSTSNSDRDHKAFTAGIISMLNKNAKAATLAATSSNSKGKGKEIIIEPLEDARSIVVKKPIFVPVKGDPLEAGSARFKKKNEGKVVLRTLTKVKKGGRALDRFDDDDDGVFDDENQEAKEDSNIYGVKNVKGVEKIVERIPEVDGAAKRLGLATPTSLIRGMKISLLPFQVIGVDWMVTREVSQYPGGINADDMGLGKTVQTLALMCHRKSADPVIATNLIIVPLSCIAQWESEIATKCLGLSSHVYHLGMNKDKANSVAEIMSYDCIITTHGTVSGEYHEDDKCGLLFDCTFYRVIVDEAQIIRNRATRVSRAVSHLDAVHRWLLSGTPVVNTLADFFPLLRFLRAKPYSDWKTYNAAVVRKEKKDPVMSGKRAQEILAPYIIRRRKDDLLNGKPLIDLKPKVVELLKLDFSAKEKEIYDLAEREAQDEIIRLFKKGTIIKNWSHIFVMILRLRQLTIHPLLLAEEGSGGINLLEERAKAIKFMGEAVVAKLVASMLKMKTMSDYSSKFKNDPGATHEMNCCACYEPAVSRLITVCEHVVCQNCYDGLAYDDEVAKKPCPKCHRLLTSNSIFDLEAFAPTEEELAEALAKLSSMNDSDTEAMDFHKDQKPRLDIKPRIHHNSQPSTIIIHDSDSEVGSEDELPPLATALAKFKTSIKSEDVKSRIELDDKKPRIKSEDVTPSGRFGFADMKPNIKPFRLEHSDLVEPSTKMIHLLKQLKAWELEDPRIKTVVICSFVRALDLVDSILTAEEIPFARFQGSSSPDDRAQALRSLATDPECRVLLLSLKAGGVGLNLVSACRVISLDLAWSPMIENQAYDRVYRLGQIREVRVERLTCFDTIEERIAVLQSRKQLYFDFSLQEGQGALDFKGAITVADILGLFKLDKNGKRLNSKASAAEASVKAGLGPRGGGIARNDEVGGAM